MRKTLAIALIAAAALVVVAAPAMAQRDPLEPVVNAPAGSADAPSTQIEPDAPTIIDRAPETEVIAETGVEARDWLGLAYVLAAVGAGALVLAKVLEPAR